MERRKLGRQGLSVSSVGLGCMSLGIADIYSSAIRSDDEAVALIHRAIDLGVTFLDTANIYGDSELKVGKALKGRRDQVELATKFGFTEASASTPRTGGIDGRPGSGTQSVRHLAAAPGRRRISISITCTGSIRMCRSKRRSAPWPTWCAPERSAIWACRKPAPPPSGARTRFIRSPRCRSEYSLWSRDPEDEILPTVQELGIGFVAYSPLGRGVPGRPFQEHRRSGAGRLAARQSPRFQGENFAQEPGPGGPGERARPEQGLHAVAARARLVAGAKQGYRADPRHQQRARLEENAAATNVRLTPGDLAELDRIAPKGAAVGQRYAPAMMDMVNR